MRLFDSRLLLFCCVKLLHFVHNLISSHSMTAKQSTRQSDEIHLFVILNFYEIISY